MFLLQEEKVRCPMSGKPLKFKDLIPVTFTLLKDKDDKRSLIAKDVILKPIILLKTTS